VPPYKPIGQETPDNHRRSRISPGYVYYCINKCYSDYTNRNLGINTALKSATSAVHTVDRSQTNKIKKKANKHVKQTQ